MGKRSAVVIRPEKPQDYAGVHEIHRLAFRRENEARLIESLRLSPGYIPELSIVAFGGKNVVGHILFSPIGIETPYGELPALVMAPLAVRPAEKENVGEKLLKAGIKECRRRGYACVLAVGAPADYSRFGFVPAHPLGLNPARPIKGGELMALELTPSALEGLTGTVRFPPAYAGLWEAASLF
jgi:putative acetyltransferase